MTTAWDRLQNIFRLVFDDEALVLTPATGPGQIPNWDSVAQVKLVLATEEEFGLHLRMDQVVSLRTAGDFLRLVEISEK